MNWNAKRTLTLASLLVAAVGMVVWRASCAREGRGDRPHTRRVTRRDITIRIRETGCLEPWKSVSVSPGLQGHVTIVAMAPEGGVAERGDELMRFDPSTVEQEIGALKQALGQCLEAMDRATLRLESERLRAEGLPSLLEKGFITQKELDAAQLRVREAEVGLAAVDASR